MANDLQKTIALARLMAATGGTITIGGPTLDAVIRELAETHGERIEALAGEEVPFLVRVAARKAVRDIVRRWHEGGAPQAPEEIRQVLEGGQS